MAALETRFMLPADNLIADAAISSIGVVKGGAYSGIVKEGIGTGTCIASSTSAFGFLGTEDIIFTVEIHDVTAGKAVGQAKFRWRTNKTTAGLWEASNITTSVSQITLSAGSYGEVDVEFPSGSFELYDRFYVTGFSTFATNKTFDERRDTYMQTLDVGLGYANYIHVWDMGGAVRVTAFALIDVTPVVTMLSAKLYAGTTSACSDYTLDLAPLSAINIHYIDKTYRYWKLELRSTAEIKVGQTFLGQYRVCVSSPSVDYGSGVSSQLLSEGLKKLSLKWDMLRPSDMTILRGIYADSVNRNYQYVRPIFLHLFHTDSTSFYWTKIVSDLSHTYRTFNAETATLELEEVAANYVI